MTEICGRCHGIGGVLSQATGRMIEQCTACGGTGEIEADE